MRGNIYEKYKKAKIIEKKRAERAPTKSAYISEQMALGKATVDKLEAAEEDDERVEGVGKLTNTRMAEMLVIYRNTVRVQTA